MITINLDKQVLIQLPNIQASEDLASKLAICLTSPLILGFSGQIGAGKTTIIRALLRNLGITSAIKSPTFSLVESYNCTNHILHHFDLYRIQHPDELEYLGFRDYFTKESICCIEWAEHAGHLLPEIDICFKLSIKGTGRLMQVDALSNPGTRLLACLAGES